MRSVKNSQVAKNTAFLYFRMIVTLSISLYTTRIVLKSLGADDFGIYSVVGSVVAMLAFLNATMISTSNRFLSYELGAGNLRKLKKTFQITYTLHFILALIVLVILETVGLWFVKHKLNIAVERLWAAEWVFHFSAWTSLLLIIQVPFKSTLVANEKLGIYAFITIFNVLFKLILIFLLLYTAYDKLVIYGLLLFLVELISTAIIVIYSLRKFKETSVSFGWDKKIVNKIFSFSLWNLYGQFVIITTEHVLLIVLNIFFGTVVNASRGIASKLNSVIFNFVTNFQLALNPAITKSFAEGDKDNSKVLIFSGSKYGFFLMLLLSLPVLFELEFLLNLWFDTVPKFTVEFSRLLIINTIIDTLIGPLEIAMNATGKVKRYKITVYTITFLILPLSYLVLLTGFEPYAILYVQILFTILTLILRVWFVKKEYHFTYLKYFKEVLFKVLSVQLLVLIVPIILILSLNLQGFNRFIINGPITFISSVVIIYFFGLNSSERQFIIGKIKKVLPL